MKKVLIPLILLVILIPVMIFAQVGGDSLSRLSADKGPVHNISFSGKVTELKTGLPLAGATVHITGTTHEVITKNDGKFSFLTGQRFPVTVVISYVGYQTKQVIIPDPTPVQIRLAETSSNLNEVVVVGYGTQKKSDLTGSVASVSPSVIKQSVVSSFDRVLQGSVAGVQVTQASGQPGSAVSIRIRGGNSITGGNEPLYVIDGFPVYNDNSDNNAGVTSGPSINALASINPADIETIDVLKDASATAIYGSRGANGVVIITTKKGKVGQNTVNYEGYYGQQELIKKFDVLTSSKDWALLKNEALINSGKAPLYTQAQLDAMTGGTDWQAAAFEKAPIQNHQFSIAGGDERTRYAIGLNYFNQEGIVFNSGFNRYSARLNLERTVSEKFKTGVNLTASKIQADEANANIISTLLLLPPTVPIRDASGKYLLQSPFEVALGNPIASLEQEINRSTTFRVLGNIYGDYSILPDLTARISIGGDILNNKQNRYIPSTLQEAYTTNGFASVGSKVVNTWLNENTLTYNTKWGKHALTALAGYTQQSYSSENATASAKGFVSDLLTYNNLGSGSISVLPASGATEWSLKSFIGRVNYSFRQKYYLTLTARADGSSRFGKNNKWGYFPSAALAWNIGREDFLKGSSVISNLKLRVSGGITGNQEIGQFQSLATLANSGYLIGNILAVGFSPSRIANPDLSWEKTTQFDAGIDIGLFQGAINIVIDAYYKRTGALLLTVPLPYTTGYTSSLQNYGTIANKGVEISVNTQNIDTKDFSWSTQFIFSANRNKVISLGQGVQYLISDPLIAKVGEALGSFYGYRSDGIFQLTDDITKLPTVDPTNTKPGDRRYKDLNKDGKITQADDREIIGSAQPKFLAGITNNLSWRSFDLSFLLYTSYGNDLFSQNRQQLELFSGQQNVASSALDRWSPTNPSNVVQRAKEDPAPITSSRYVEDASYLRLKNITLGYTLPASLLRAIRIKQLRIYISGNNLLTWTSYTGYDPDVSKNEQTTLTQGIDYGIYPQAKAILAGISITL